MGMNDINCGNCEDFAMEIMDYFCGENNEIYGVWLEDFHNCNVAHFVIFYNNKYYDAECINGVEDWKEIPAYLNRNKRRYEVLSLENKDKEEI